MTDIRELAAGLSQKVEQSRYSASALLDRYNGHSPLSYLSPEAQQALGSRLQRVSANYCRVAVDELAQRMRIVGLDVNGSHDADLWRRWERAGMVAGSGNVTKGSLIAGRAAVSVWGHGGNLSVRPESALQTAWSVDPVSQQPTAALKRWQGSDGKPKAILSLSERLVLLSSPAYLPDGSFVPPEAWQQVGELPNPLGVPNIFPLVNGLTTESAEHGDSEITPLAAANDLLEKLLTDAAVSSESTSRPQRYISGLESLPEDENGNPVVPFGPELKTWIATEADVKFGQLPGDIGGYDQLISLVLQIIAGLSGLPANVLGVSHDNPTSADAIAASGLTLTSRASDRCTIHDPQWSNVVAAMVALRDGGDLRSVDASVVRADPRYSSEAAEADAVVKLYGSGLLSRSAALRRLGYSPNEIASIETDAAREAVQKQLLAP